MLSYTDKNWYHFIKEYLEQISKFAFQEIARPVGWLNRHTLEILLACSHTLVAQNCGTSVRLHHWGNLMFFLYFSYFSNCFCIFHSSVFIDFCHATNGKQVFPILEYVLSELSSKMINRNFAFVLENFTF